MKKLNLHILSVFLCFCVSCAFAKVDPQQQEQKLRSFITHVSKQFEVQRLSKADQIIEYAKSNQIEKVELIRIAGALASEAADRVNNAKAPKKHTTEIMQCNSVFSLLAKLDDPSVLELLEKTSTHTNEIIRTDASIAFVRIAGVEAIPFIEMKRKDARFDEFNTVKLFDAFSAYLTKENKDQTKAIKALDYLLTTLEKEQNGEIASHLDKVLNLHLVGYDTSIQRFRIMERLAKHENAHYRKLFQTIVIEIKKQPIEKRKDLRAAGEKLDMAIKKCAKE